MSLTAARIHDKARELGFTLCGIAPAEPSPTLAHYLRWIQRGMHGEMGYMARPDRVRRRQDLREVLPGARSLIIIGLDYRASFADEDALKDPARGRIASYAWGVDYHQVLSLRLESFAEWMLAECGGLFDHKIYVDTGALLERSHAQQAGLGFIGKNTMLIHPRRGSSFFLGEIITSLELDDYDTPQRETMCGTCARCLAACPTAAFPAPFVLDARRCISYHTIENKGWVDRDLRADFGNWIFGCDICMDTCPFQRFTAVADEMAFLPLDMRRVAPKLVDMLMLDEGTFRQLFRRSPVERIGRERLVRNACIAAGNWQDKRVVPHLIQLLYDTSPLVRGHAAWALWQTMGLDSSKLLTDLYQRDDDEGLRGEVAALLG
ncbi:MAG: tRNA epoxyqueuosine(34) reductase QueG [Chloroflexi bacterium]|nr:tRNA epoxyqueuosine(34) reductase QueG [Chloroflexota bacterium]MCY4248533.1 tRNA epoxyqueuosine(34) reductase QueG [Chloroflexota bacterium]